MPIDWQYNRRRGEFELSDVPNLKGKTALVTGSNGGIGKCAAHILAEKGARVYVAVWQLTFECTTDTSNDCHTVCLPAELKQGRRAP